MYRVHYVITTITIVIKALFSNTLAVEYVEMENAMSENVSREDNRLKTYRSKKSQLSQQMVVIMLRGIGDIITGEAIARIATVLDEYYSDPEMEAELQDSSADEESVVPIVQFMINEYTERTDGCTEINAYIFAECFSLPPYSINNVENMVNATVEYALGQLREFVFDIDATELEFTDVEDGKLFRIKASGPLGRKFKKYYRDNKLKLS